MDPLKSILEFLKLTPRYLIAVALFCGFLLFSTKEFLERIGAFDFAEDYRSWIGAAFLASLCIWIVAMLFETGGFIQKLIFKRKIEKKIIKRLHALTEDEKQILRYYIAKQTRSNKLRIDDGSVKGLVSAHVIYRSTQMGDMLEGFGHNISELAWNYLNINPGLLEGETNTYRTDKREGRYW